MKCKQNQEKRQPRLIIPCWNFSQLCKNQQRHWYWYWFHRDQYFSSRKQLWWILGYLVFIFFSLCVSHCIKPHLRTLHPCSTNKLGKILEVHSSYQSLCDHGRDWGQPNKAGAQDVPLSPTVSTPGFREHRKGTDRVCSSTRRKSLLFAFRGRITFLGNNITKQEQVRCCHG